MKNLLTRLRTWRENKYQDILQTDAALAPARFGGEHYDKGATFIKMRQNLVDALSLRQSPRGASVNDLLTDPAVIEMGKNMLCLRGPLRSCTQPDGGNEFVKHIQCLVANYEVDEQHEKLALQYPVDQVDAARALAISDQLDPKLRDQFWETMIAINAKFVDLQQEIDSKSPRFSRKSK